MVFNGCIIPKPGQTFFENESRGMSGLLETPPNIEIERLKCIFKIKYDVLDTFGEYKCRLWSYSIKSKYPKFKFCSDYLNKPIVVKVHIISFYLEHSLLPKLENGTKMEISHLCHNPHCCEVLHLQRESKSTNELRKNCKKAGVCLGHLPSQNCLLPTKV